MATTSATGGTSMGSAMSSLQQSIAAARDRVAAQSTAQGTGETAPADEIKEYRKDVRKSPYNTPGAATDIGMLTKNTSRLNVISSMQAKDPADFYKFRVTTPGEITVGKLGDENGGNVRVQVMTKLGIVIADSDEKAGKANEAYRKMQEGTFEMARGEYVLRVSREPGADAKSTPNYALQLRMGDYKADYDTVARAPNPGDGLPTQSAAMQKLQSMLNTSVSSIQSLPPIGTSATQKLLGTVFSGSF